MEDMIYMYQAKKFLFLEETISGTNVDSGLIVTISKGCAIEIVAQIPIQDVTLVRWEKQLYLVSDHTHVSSRMTRKLKHSETNM